jgi:hypothetical protein
LLRRGERDAGRGRNVHIVAETELEAQGGALHGRAVTDADELAAFLEAGGHTVHHVGHQRAGQAPHALGALRVDARRQRELVALLLQLDFVGDRPRELTLGALHRDRLARERQGDVRGDDDGFLTDP